MHEKDAIYTDPDATEADYLRAGELEHDFGEMGDLHGRKWYRYFIEQPGY